MTAAAFITSFRSDTKLGFGSALSMVLILAVSIAIAL